ncbi:unannotated protein [freshwater metagenome]|uniref:Unannotated protein n=1 Tax=freshwater metagenome TaxID=449393 RepID=A0A6J7ID80_9ZZZZ|nr:hypothetical protein [Actinomycetota bacterium]
MSLFIPKMVPLHSPEVPYEVDPLTISSPPGNRWTTANTGEQMPGVLTPFTITMLAQSVEMGFLGAFAYLGIIPKKAVKMPQRREDYHLGYFYGYCAANVRVVRHYLDIFPGTSGAAYEAQMFGGDGVGEADKLPWIRKPIVAVKMRRGLRRIPTEMRELRAELLPWWRSEVRRLETATLAETKQACIDAQVQYYRAVPYVWASAVIAQLSYMRLCELAAESGNPGTENVVCGGYGTEEIDMATDLWRVSRGRMTKEEFLDHHGWTVPLGMEIAEPSWRENPDALDGLIATYAGMSDDEEPGSVLGRRADERIAGEQAILSGLPKNKRKGALRAMHQASEYMQVRTIQKVASAMAWDVFRAAARRMGDLYVEAGMLDDASDVFQLTAAELLGPELPADAKAIVADRRRRHDEYLDYRLPVFWEGDPEVERISQDTSEAPLTVEGMGVSPGVVEGVVRVITSPTGAAVEQGEILVCVTTDPSWVSLMVPASGLVIDIGGPVSHGAIVARELGVPCVINTRTGTSTLKTGQRVRVDGSTGVVEILS